MLLSLNGQSYFIVAFFTYNGPTGFKATGRVMAAFFPLHACGCHCLALIGFKKLLLWANYTRKVVVESIG